jgi:hypothetical protein
VGYGSTSFAFNIAPEVVTAQTWAHVALVRNSGTVTLYVNGTGYLVGSSQPDTEHTEATNGYLVIGGYYTTSYLMNGYLQDFRISKIARYTGNFTVPSTEFLKF